MQDYGPKKQALDEWIDKSSNQLQEVADSQESETIDCLQQLLDQVQVSVNIAR